MRLIVVLAALIANGCVIYDPNQPVPIIAEGPDWVRSAIDESMIFWHNHGVLFTPSDHGIHVIVGLRYNGGNQSAPGFFDAGQYWYDDGTVHIAERLETDAPQAKCVIAHELGHSIGMQHLPPGSLMNIDHHMNGSACAWSIDDENELVRVGKRL